MLFVRSLSRKMLLDSKGRREYLIIQEKFNYQSLKPYTLAIIFG